MSEREDPAPALERSGGAPGRNISLSDHEDDGAADLPRLLRRVADLIEVEGIIAMEILDVVVHRR